ncbi:MAG TPA: DUF2892 domain-containing protein [Chitinophagales bacterium]|nr:DUF2892 domain-containing protein [Chitinophagales bacterium]HMW12677.1 DUF2892 domain-containing protein [Chitinophagales bacterium]HMX60258.1 DUF2892 domain-containing protein [Chitinophagales bacterium]HMY24669.1 DUF2892 domain-containing protein [Chitinophagales bacterium]HMZ34389.1 DUF2892 domain-containing protein [Chitinophagales bacterium]
MKQNMGKIDKAVRMSLAVLIAVLYFANIISGALAIILLVFATVFILTSFIGTCPLYLPFNINTNENKKA